MLLQSLKYLWALPTTCLGFLFILPSILSGGKARIVQGICEVEGPPVRFFLRHLTFMKGGASAMTLGHVVIGGDRQSLDRTRRHEHVHVRQCERWGPFFVPAYLVASLLVKLRGRDGYLDNPFEIEAYLVSDGSPEEV